MEKALWGKRIADKLHAGEKQIDDAIRMAMDVIAEVQAAQGDMNVSAVATDSSIAKLVETLNSLQQARSNLVAGHRRLEKLGEGLGIRPVGIGAGKTLVDDNATTAMEERRATV